MARSFEDLVGIGVRYATRKLLAQAEVSERQARTAATELATRFPAARMERIGALRAEIGAASADRSVAATDKVGLTQVQETAFADAKAWIRDLRDAASSAFDGDEARADAYTRGAKIGRSVPRLVETLEKLGALAATDALALAAEGFSTEDVARGQQVHAHLRDANSVQEAAIKALPPRTKDLCAKKGELYLLLKALERAARRTWPQDVAKAGAFRLTLLKRGGTHIEPPAPAPAPPPG